MPEGCCLCRCLKCGYLRTRGASNTRAASSILLPSNPHTDDTEALMVSSVEWLACRVNALLTGQGEADSEMLFRQSLFQSPPTRRTMQSVRRSTVAVDAGAARRGSVQAPTQVATRRRQRCHKIMQKLLKLLQAESRNPDKAAVLMSDEILCRLLPLAICNCYFDLPPSCELLLAKTLANLSCQQPSHAVFSTSNLICNLVDGWRESPCLLLSLCGRKIAANLSTYALMATLNKRAAAAACRPHCVYQPDVYELARPFLTVPIMDVVFVNGMLGSVFYTWKQGDDSVQGCSECWPRDWLAEDLPRARVLALNMKIAAIKCRCRRGSNSDTAGCLPRRANEALTQLLAAGVGNRLTAFVCHSFGGLIVKQLLQVLHNSSEDPVRRKFLSSVRGVVFIAVPHLGRSKAVNVNRCYWRPVRSLCLSDEAKNVFDGSCRVLSHLHAWFVQYAQTRPDLHVLNLIEMGKTQVAPGGLKFKICPETWADKLVGDVVRIQTDHIMICKPANRDHEAYTSVQKFLTSLGSLSSGWRPALLATMRGLDGSEWHEPVLNSEQELRLRYGVSSARDLWTSSSWHKFRAKNRPRFYDML